MPDTVTNSSGPTFANLFCTVAKRRILTRATGTAARSMWRARRIPSSTSRPSRPSIVCWSCRLLQRLRIIHRPAFKEGLDRLPRGTASPSRPWVPPNASSEDNAKSFAQYIREHVAQDKRKYIVIGYSKGAPTFRRPWRKAGRNGCHRGVRVRGGAIGGSAIADVLPAQADQWIQRFKLGACTGDVSAAFNSLKRSVRRAFLAENRIRWCPATRCPRLRTWEPRRRGSRKAGDDVSFSTRQDSQLTEDDAIIPGSKVLGSAKADHLAVALPFDKAADAAVRAIADKGKYPRAALLEAIVRSVSA